MIKYLKDTFTYQNIKKSVLILGMIILCIVIPPMICLFSFFWIIKKIKQEEAELPEEKRQYYTEIEINDETI